MNIATFLKSQKFMVYAMATIVAALIFNYAFGIGVIVPTNITWLMSARHDWGQHYLGWAFYRNEPWAFPLGQINALCYPSGTNIGFTDSIPLLAIIMKPFSAILPQDFQYLGLWLLFCYIMAGIYTVKIFNLYKVKTFYTLIAVVFVVGNPVLVFRGIHPALCSHWLILAAIYYYLKPATVYNARQLNINQIILIVASALITPYMCLMLMGFGFILPLKNYFYDKALTKKQAIIYPALSCIMVLVVWLIVGMIDLKGQSDIEVVNSYGLYGYNLNGLINSAGFSYVMPNMYLVSWHQYEGYAYLGLGMLVLIPLTVVYLLINQNYKALLFKKSYLLPLLILAICLVLFAITNTVTFNKNVVFQFQIPGIITKFGNIFRASSRFVWVGYYLIFLSIILIVAKSKLKNMIKAPVLALLCLLQFHDITKLYKSRDLPYGSYNSPLTESKWNEILPPFKRMITYPPFTNHLLNPTDYQDLAFVASNNNKYLSCGYVARENLTANGAYTDSLNKAIDSGVLRDDELYITTAQHLDDFSYLLHNKYLNLQYLDGYYLLYTNKNVVTIQDKQALHKRDLAMRSYNETMFNRTISNPVFTNSKIQYNIEDLFIKDNAIAVKGWAFENNTAGNKGDSVFVALASAGKLDIVSTRQLPRQDIAAAFKKPTDNLGFATVIYSANHIKNDAMVCIAVKNAAGNWTYTQVNTISKLISPKPVKLDKVPATNHQIGVIDELADQKNDVIVRGWTFFDDRSDKNTQVEVVFIGKAGNFAVVAGRTVRSDVASAYPKFDYNNSGYNVRVNKKDLPAGTYSLGVLIRDTKTKEKSMLTLDKTVTIK